MAQRNLMGRGTGMASKQMIGGKEKRRNEMKRQLKIYPFDLFCLFVLISEGHSRGL